MAEGKMKNILGSAGGFLLLIAFAAVPVLLLFGAAELSVKALDWIPNVIGIAIVLCLAITPLALIPGTREFASNLFQLASYAFGACLWLYCLAFTYIQWGILAVFIGVMLLGVGVVFTGILATIFSAGWIVLGNIAILFGLWIGTRVLGIWLGHSAKLRALRKQAQELPAEAIIIPAHRIES